MARALSVAVVLLALLPLIASSGWAQPGPAQSRRALVQDAASQRSGGGDGLFGVQSLAARRPAPQPHMDYSVQPTLRFKLDEAYQVAVEALRRQPSCDALFGAFSVRGEEILAQTVYLGGGEIGACLQSVPAFTCVGCRRTVLCPLFSRLSSAGGATILLHEALHFAGLKERPGYPGAMSSAEITTMVTASCRL